MAILHEYRNQLYHVGLRDDPIIGQLAHLYFHLAVGLLEPLLGAQRHLRWEPEVISDTARRLMPELATTKYRRAKVDIAALRDRLLAACPHPQLPFDSWRKQATSIARKRQALLALEMFDRLRKEVDLLEDIMVEPIQIMHGWHQHLEDVAMDSR